ncbi:Mom family adenine methylcarbamoylation protein [Bilophila wadsworthia]
MQSFADERCGRLGVVYQASNFLLRMVSSGTSSWYERGTRSGKCL